MARSEQQPKPGLFDPTQAEVIPGPMMTSNLAFSADGHNLSLRPQTRELLQAIKESKPQRRAIKGGKRTLPSNWHGA